MLATLWEVHKGWLIRVSSVLTITVLIDAAAVWCSVQPRLWATLIPATLPVSTALVVAIPILGEAKRKG